MSTKIYDAYIMNKQMSTYELNQFCDELRKKVTYTCRKMLQDEMVKNFLYFRYFKELHGDDKVKEMVEKTAENKKSAIYHIWEKLLDEDWKALYLWICLDMLELLRKNREDAFFENIPDEMNCKLGIYPLEDKTLLLYFGNHKARAIIENDPNILDYHYQNQTDRPEYITEQEWNQRREDWNQAIGPDYVPSYHGFMVNLFNSDEAFTLYDNRFELSLPTEEKMIKELRGTCRSIEEVEGYPGKNGTYGSWKKFVRTVQYKKWVEETNEVIKSKCHFLTTKEEVEKLIGKK